MATEVELGGGETDHAAAQAVHGRLERQPGAGAGLEEQRRQHVTVQQVQSVLLIELPAEILRGVHDTVQLFPAELAAVQNVDAFQRIHVSLLIWLGFQLLTVWVLGCAQ